MTDNFDTLESEDFQWPLAIMRQLACILFAAGMLWATGCGHEPYSVTSPDPSSKIPAIEIAVQNHDPSVDGQLVKDLDNSDPAIRFYSIEGLRKLTGQDFGYAYYDDEDKRKPAVDRWKQWLASRQR